MISYKRLPGSSLAGLDMFNFSSYWNTIKNKIAALQNLGYQISLHQQHLGTVKAILVARNDPNQNIMDDDIAKAADDLSKWWTVKGYIDKYLPTWMAADQPGTTIVNGLSILPIILGVAAIAALAYCVNTGMALLQDYEFKSQLTTAIIEQKITSGQAAEILSVPRPSSFVEETFEKATVAVAGGLGFGIPTALLVAGGAYLLYTTGVLNGLLGMLKGIGGGSSSSNGV
jgi:hypothetical protein